MLPHWAPPNRQLRPTPEFEPSPPVQLLRGVSASGEQRSKVLRPKWAQIRCDGMWPKAAWQLLASTMQKRTFNSTECRKAWLDELTSGILLTDESSILGAESTGGQSGNGRTREAASEAAWPAHAGGDPWACDGLAVPVAVLCRSQPSPAACPGAHGDIRRRCLPDPAPCDQARRAHPQPGSGPLVHADRRWPSWGSGEPGPDRRT